MPVPVPACFLRLREPQQRFRKLDVGVRGIERGLCAKPGQISARHLIGHLVTRALVVRFDRFDGHFGRLIAADGAEVEHGLAHAGAHVEHPEGTDEGREC